MAQNMTVLTSYINRQRGREECRPIVSSHLDATQPYEERQVEEVLLLSRTYLCTT